MIVFTNSYKTLFPGTSFLSTHEIKQENCTQAVRKDAFVVVLHVLQAQ